MNANDKHADAASSEDTESCGASFQALDAFQQALARGESFDFEHWALQHPEAAENQSELQALALLHATRTTIAAPQPLTALTSYSWTGRTSW